MKSLFLRATLAIALSTFPGSANTKPAPSAPPTHAATAINTDPSPQVFLRRLHLVRPDLIPYPITVEIFC